MKRKARRIAALLFAVGLVMKLFWEPMMAVRAAEPGSVSAGDADASSPIDITVPIYNYDVLNVMVPASYLVAFNPYRLEIGTGEGEISDAQVISRNYGIVNKSTRDKLVTIILTVEDLNEGRITFVNSAEEAMNAGEDVFAVYLTLVPANQKEIQVDGQPLDKDITAEALAKVSMEGSADNAVVLKEGENQVTFMLSRAEYDFFGAIFGADAGGNAAGAFELTGLAAGGTGVTAFTFDGVLNPNADWTKLGKAVKITVVYVYENAIGDEVIIEGTGAMVSRQ